ncbi:ABC transporter permease [Halobacteriaceae archaeon GCM10025711]
MFEVTRYEARRRLRGSFVMAVAIGLFALLIVGVFPSMQASGADFEAYIENLPPAVREGFGVSSSAITTVEGFLATEIYQFIWVLLLGLYMAYVAGGTIAGDVESGRMDLILATPVSRSKVLVEKYLSLLSPILLLNLLVPLFVYGGVIAIDETIDFVSLVAVHLLSIPYLLLCAAIGLLLSVLVSREDLAQRGGIAAVFFLFVTETVTVDTDFEWLGAISPTRYYDTAQILVEETYDLGGAAILLAAAFVLLAISQFVFTESDL